MENHPLSGSYIQTSYLKQYESLANELEIKDKTRVLDIGSGLGYFKYITHKRGGLYLGIENDKQVYMLAKKLYGDGGFINESFPVDKIYNKKFDIIIVLSCLDEICKKEIFLECVKKNLKKNSILYIAVRNQAFILNRLKPIFNIKKQVIPDLDLMEYKKLFTKKGYKIISDGKFYRPWVTGFNLIGVKNLIYKVISKILPKNISYMLYFKLRIN